jgi:ketosteroid isomerase-like protein
VKRTQELVDSVASGDKRPWRRYFADDCLFFDEKGTDMKKETLVADIVPLPTGYSGNIKMQNVKSLIEGNVAILSYDLDETEIAYGQTMKARYHETDTWMRRGGDWQIVAGQVLRYYEDPAPGESDAKKYPEDAGTYEAAPGKTVTVSLEDGRLFFQRGDRARVELVPEAEGIFFRPGVEGRILFRRGADGKVDKLIERRNNEDIVWKRRE